MSNTCRVDGMSTLIAMIQTYEPFHRVLKCQIQNAGLDHRNQIMHWFDLLHRKKFSEARVHWLANLIGCNRSAKVWDDHGTEYSKFVKFMGPLHKNIQYIPRNTHGFCFAGHCCGYTLTGFPISIRLTSLALWQSNDCPSASKATLMNMDKYFMWIHYERLHNHNKAKHNKTVCIFFGIYCTSEVVLCLLCYRNSDLHGDSIEVKLIQRVGFNIPFQITYCILYSVLNLIIHAFYHSDLEFL